jgi:hypothetical protein
MRAAVRQARMDMGGSSFGKAVESPEPFTVFFTIRDMVWAGFVSKHLK